MHNYVIMAGPMCIVRRFSTVRIYVGTCAGSNFAREPTFVKAPDASQAFSPDHVSRPKPKVEDYRVTITDPTNFVDAIKWQSACIEAVKQGKTPPPRPKGVGGGETFYEPVTFK